ncbi:hypothetical protein LNAOJCKE_1735 [Methylorubrum aminovorans]|uniref:BioF2-like acetyltransferase domain-containing protein n=1 Tax=Methylorubrum aminovorans TaxID=269069 RepID=A0ABQ4UB12_9HYPH|nr:GNAT family N-acetyltransferase [Methylorubrum aminovorans]GJE64529.1 hypothetical protein LNAOJCKE_1735 [Methylorubrum aminovorans]
MTALDRPLAAARASSATDYRAETATRFEVSALRGGTAPTPFQGADWLASWYEAMAGRAGLTPVIVTVRQARTGELALVLPLVLRRIGSLRLIEFADLDLTDYNAPLIGPAAPRDRREAARLWRAVRRALPPADLVRLAKMETAFGGAPNPLALLPGAIACALNGNLVRLGPDYDAWRYAGLERTARKELERIWRVFTKHPDAAFERVTDPAWARAVLAAIENLQKRRMDALGATYFLNEPDVAAVYHRLVERGLADGSTVVTALVAGGEIVAGLLGLRLGERYIMIRIGQAGGRWSNCSPGRLVIERTMAFLHAEGVRCVDFSIGNYDYKRRFGTEPLALVDLVAPLGWRGLAPALRARLVGRLRAHPELDRRLRAWLGRFTFAKV